MRHLAVYLMLQLGGNDSPSKEDVTKALSAVGVEADSESLDKMMAGLADQSVEELLEAGKELLATFGGGGGGAAAGGDAGAGGAAAAKEEVKEEEEEIDMAGGMDMFGGESGGGGGDY